MVIISIDATTFFGAYYESERKPKALLACPKIEGEIKLPHLLKFQRVELIIR